MKEKNKFLLACVLAFGLTSSAIADAPANIIIINPIATGCD